MENWELADHARVMRNAPTEREKRLWRNLSGSRLGGFKFRRQATISPFIVDFLCPAKALIVEIDRDTHDATADRRRDAFLAGKGYHVIRFTNEDVMRNVEGVLETILRVAISLPDRWVRPHPNPSPEGEGLSDASAPPLFLSKGAS